MTTRAMLMNYAQTMTSLVLAEQVRATHDVCERTERESCDVDVKTTTVQKKGRKKY